MHRFYERAKLTKNICAQKLFRLMEDKETNLALSADLTSIKDIIMLADTVGSKICLLKTHVDILEDFNLEYMMELYKIAEKYNFLIFEDRKFADIGHTVKNQYQGGIYHIADWSHIINAHPLPGYSVIEGLQQIGLPKNRALLLIAEMSSKNNLISEEYTKLTLGLANSYAEFVAGFICRQKITDNPGFIHLTPGVKFTDYNDNLGQQYLTPRKVIYELESDIIIVGRGIIKSENPSQVAEEYRKEGWVSYLDKLYA